MFGASDRTVLKERKLKRATRPLLHEHQMFFLGGWVSRQWSQYSYALLFQLLGEDSLWVHGVKQPTRSGGTMI